MGKRKTTEEFIEEARKIHGEKFDYSKVNYVNNKTKVCIIYNNIEYFITPKDHLKGEGCPYLSNKLRNSKNTKTTSEFIEKSIKIHGNKYDYSESIYVNHLTPLKIICKKHGKFTQKPSDHLSGCGCPICGGSSKLTTSEFIERAKIVHENKNFDYSKVEYVNSNTKVCIICPEHGEFWQTPHDFIRGVIGCKKCNEKKLEKDIEFELQNNDIKYEREKHFKWLGKKSLDFYLPDYNIAIECQGVQHFEPVEFFGGEESFKKQIKNDFEKYKICETHNIKIIYYSSIIKEQKEYFRPLINNKNEIIELIKKI